jgi:hypothetical protein
VKGFDLDGVITIGIFPGPDDVIISGRSVDEALDTLLALRALGIKNQVFFSPVEVVEKNETRSGTFKARVIRRLGITQFFEDSYEQAAIIKKLCPSCAIVMIRQTVTNGTHRSD